MSGKHIVFGVKAEFDSYQAKGDKLHDIPRTGIHIGRKGIYVDMSSPGNPGWTLHWDNGIEHPTKKEFAHISMDPDKEGDKTQLDAAEIADLEAKKLLEQELTADWYPEDEIAPEPAPAPAPDLKP